MVYEPTLTEQTRQDFVLSLKLLTNGPLQQRVRDAYRQRLAAAPAPPATESLVERHERERQLAQQPEFRHWATLTHASQSMMWRAVDLTARRVAADAQRQFESLANKKTLGSLQLQPSLPVPNPIANTEIHRQPGGFVGREQEDTMLPGLRYFGSSRIYAPGKGNVDAGRDARGAFLVEQIQQRFPGIRPARILELGCGLGVASHSVALAWPDAEYHAVDVAGPLLQMAHLLAEEKAIGIHFHQRDAAHAGFPDGHFDLIISHIMFHETNSARLPQILRECRRLLAPKAVMLHVDVATQVTRLGFDDQLMNDWQVRWNGEPFWAAFARIDMQAEMLRAGFAEGKVFAAYRSKPGAGVSYVFGAAA
jgi:ubiquinone/menaquinone biosynthesis C-methylase UbiE